MKSIGSEVTLLIMLVRLRRRLSTLRAFTGHSVVPAPSAPGKPTPSSGLHWHLYPHEHINTYIYFLFLEMIQDSSLCSWDNILAEAHIHLELS